MNAPRRPQTADTLEAEIATLLADDSQRESPLWQALAALNDRYREQLRLLDRITRISDRYQQAELEAKENHIEYYRRKVRQAEKMIRISDQYQAMVREINEKLLHLSTHDALTTLPNRRFAQETLDKHIDSARSTGFPLCIALLDVDHFKDINDRYGHESGDESLIAIAEGIRNSLRESDFCGRWGGEEFLVTLPHTDLQVAGFVAERVRQAVANLPAFILDNGITIKVTVSIGLTELRPDDTTKTLLSRADKALYQAKDEGRNRTVVI
jgi:diguanylate cyclase (GGDEF)-like protein